MQICFYANLRTIAQRPALNLEEPGLDTLGQLIQRLIEFYPEMTPHLLDEKGGLRTDVPLFVNGRNPRLTNTVLKFFLGPDDVISIFSPIASGRMNVEGMRDDALTERNETDES